MSVYAVPSMYRSRWQWMGVATLAQLGAVLGCDSFAEPADESDLVPPPPVNDVMAPPVAPTGGTAIATPDPTPPAPADVIFRGARDRCEVDDWPAPDAPRREYSCTPDLEGFRCNCAGIPELPEPFESCADALREVCGIDPDAPNFCDARGGSACWPGDGEGGWLCDCGTGDGFAPVQAEDCTTALVDSCADRCDSEFGVCTEDVDAPGSYGCRCSGDLHDRVPPEGSACVEALGVVCGELCETDAGSCAFDSLIDAFRCECVDGVTDEVPLPDVGGAHPEACRDAALRACGEPMSVPVFDCTSDDGLDDGLCIVIPPLDRPGAEPPTTRQHRCHCNGSDAVMVEARTCFAALVDACPDAIPSGLGAATAGDPGALCAADDDCDDACFVPGTEEDAICAPGCADDGDCPNGTACAVLTGASGDAAGHCLRSCEHDVECGLLNDAWDNPLYCAPRAVLDGAAAVGDRVCIQVSEP